MRICDGLGFHRECGGARGLREQIFFFTDLVESAKLPLVNGMRVFTRYALIDA